MSNNFRRKPWFNKKIKKPSNDYKNNIQANASRFQCTPVHGYYGFKLYFPEPEESIDVDGILNNVATFEQYIQRHIENFCFTKIKQDKVFFIDVNEVSKDEVFLKKWVTFSDDIICNTEHSLSCLSLAMHQTLMKEEMEISKSSQSTIFEIIPNISARIINFNPVRQIKTLKVNYFGKLVTVRGTVIKASNIRLFCQMMEFGCGSCSGTQVVKQINGNLTFPTKCPTKGCRAQFNFTPLISSSFTVCKDMQTLKLQELVGLDQNEDGGRIPRTLECELTGDLVNCCIPGDDITITGVIRTESKSKEQQPSMFLLYMSAISVVNNKNQSHAVHGGAHHVIFNTKDYYAIQKIHAEPSLFRFLVHSLCPSIFGHEVVKAGLLLALFGGTEAQTNIRSVSHVLMVGDPGLGKSRMLQSCTNVAPRGIYVCGNTSTGSGLTVTMVRENGEFTLEAGALVLADQGCCCIDEFDKMSKQHSCLLEVMEQQCISIAKAGVTCNLPTRTTILAAANPTGGHYNKAKTVSENLKMGSPLLSRFDLVFIILDQPDEKMDALLSEHVLSLHSKLRKPNTLQILTDNNLPQTDASLKDRLKLQPGEIIDYLPHQLFRKYIAYAQKYVHPQLSEEAAAILRQFILELRKKYQTDDSTPVTKRQFESLIRLTQARAKVELREEATANDALEVVEIMRYSLIETFLDESGNLDMTRSSFGSGMCSKNLVKRLLALLQYQAETQSKGTFTNDEIKKLAEENGISKFKFYDVLNSLNIQGFLIKKSYNRYQLVSADV